MLGCKMGFFDNKTVTLFNRSLNAETEEEKYYPTLLECVDLVETRGANISKSGMDHADAAKLYIDFSVFKRIKKTYIEPKLWESLPEIEKHKHITFTPATDFFVNGDQTGIKLPNENAFEWMYDNFDGVYKITNVDRYEDILPHFEIGGV